MLGLQVAVTDLQISIIVTSGNDEQPDSIRLAYMTVLGSEAETRTVLSCVQAVMSALILITCNVEESAWPGTRR